MLPAETNRVALYYKAETVWGETPAGGAFTQVRQLDDTLDRVKATARSATIRPDRMTDDLAVLGYEVNGDINFELSYGSWDAFLEAVLGGTWTVVTLAALTVAADGAAKTFTRTGGSWITDGVLPGQLGKFGGYVAAGNNNKFLILSVTATILTVADPLAVMVTEAGTGNETFSTESVICGVTKRSFVIEAQHQDIGKFIYYNGLRASNFELDVTAQALIKGKVSFMGKDSVASASTVSGSLVPASVNSIMSGSANVGSITKDGVALATGIKSIKLQIVNSLRKQDIVGSQATGGIGYGDLEVKGTLEAYFEDLVLLNNVNNHDTISLSFRTTDAAGQMLHWTIPSIKFTKGHPKRPGQNQDVMIPIEFEAIRNAGANSEIVVTRFIS